MKEEAIMRRRLNRKLVRGATVMAAIYVGCMSLGFHDKSLQAVEIRHIVQPSETLWSISEHYKEKDSGRDIYLPEFQDEIVRMNPWLKERHRQVSIGDTLDIVYYVPIPEKTKSVPDGADTDF